MKHLITIVFCVFAFAKAYSQNIIGVWKTVDDQTNVVKSTVEIYEKEGVYYGKILEILDPDAPDNAVCKLCKGLSKDMPIEGMVIINGMKKKGKYLKGGTILNPEDGKIYDCKIWLNKDNPDELKVRGYVLMLYRTQTWYRVK